MKCTNLSLECTCFSNMLTQHVARKKCGTFEKDKILFFGDRVGGKSKQEFAYSLRSVESSKKKSFKSTEPLIKEKYKILCNIENSTLFPADILSQHVRKQGCLLATGEGFNLTSCMSLLRALDSQETYTRKRDYSISLLSAVNMLTGSPMA